MSLLDYDRLVAHYGYDSLPNCLSDLKVRYVSMAKTVLNWVGNKRVSYQALTIEQIRESRPSSDRIFVLGGSETISDIEDWQWAQVAEHDSISMNWWPVHDFVPTYYYSNYPRDPAYFAHYRRILGPRVQAYKDTVFLLSRNRVLRRGLHPRVLPELFSHEATCCFYEYVKPIAVPDKREFKRTLYYRGGLSLILDLIYKLGYREIILLGVDLRNSVHFYDHYPEMQWQFETGYSEPVEKKRYQKHGILLHDIPVSDYIYALHDEFLSPQGISLYVGSRVSLLAERIPVWTFRERASSTSDASTRE